MNKRCAILLVLLAPSCSLVGAVTEGPRAHAYLGAYNADLQGELVTAVGPAVGFVDLDTVGIAGTQTSAYGDVQFGLGPVDLNISGYQFSSSGTGVVVGSFLGTPFPGLVQTDLDFGRLTALLGYDIIDLEVFSAGILAGVDLVYIDLFMRDLLALGVTESLDEVLPVPVLGLRAQGHPLPGLSVGARAYGLSGSYDDFSASLFDFEAGVFYEPTDHLMVFVGWRHSSTTFDGRTDANEFVDGDLTVSGPFFGVGAAF